MTQAYCVVRRTENKMDETPRYKMFIQEGGVGKLPYNDGEGDLASDIRFIKKYGSKSGDDLWPRGVWNSRRGIKDGVEYL